MNRHLASAMLVGLAFALGLSIGSHSRNDSVLPAAQAAEVAIRGDDDAITQLKEIKEELKEINIYLRTGSIKVINLINADTAPN